VLLLKKNGTDRRSAPAVLGRKLAPICNRCYVTSEKKEPIIVILSQTSLPASEYDTCLLAVVKALF
jgi:hypothetical protein